LAPRIKTLNKSYKYKISTIFDLIEQKFVLIASEYTNKQIIAYYNEYNLIESGDDIYPSFFGIAVRKSLNTSLRTKIEKL
jgi:hypothetical protein